MLGVVSHVIFSLAGARQRTMRTSSVTGLAQDRTGAVLPGARVTLLVHRTSVPSQEVVTAAAGTFQFDRVASGNYSLRVESPGFTPHVSRVRSAPSSTTTKTVMAIEGVPRRAMSAQPARRLPFSLRVRY